MIELSFSSRFYYLNMTGILSQIFWGWGVGGAVLCIARMFSSTMCLIYPLETSSIPPPSVTARNIVRPCSAFPGCLTDSYENYCSSLFSTNLSECLSGLCKNNDLLLVLYLQLNTHFLKTSIS